jgi:hypothetical protein
MSLPPDLSRLGDDLQDAARREVVRRRRAWAARTATVATLLASVSAALAPIDLGPAQRAPVTATASVSSALPRCADDPPIRRGRCGQGPVIQTDAAAGRDSDSIVMHRSDAAQSGRPRPATGPGGFATLY